MPRHGQAQNGHICILGILSTSVGLSNAKNKSGPTVTETLGIGSAEYAFANALKGKKQTNKTTTNLVLFIFSPNTLHI